VNDATDDNGGVVTVTGATWYLLEIEVNTAAGSAEFFVNGVSKGVISSGIPTAAMRISTTIEKILGTATRAFQIDYGYGYGELSVARY